MHSLVSSGNNDNNMSEYEYCYLDIARINTTVQIIALF
jgi:hypothetical protein